MFVHLAAEVFLRAGREDLAIDIAQRHNAHAGDFLEQLDVLIALAPESDDGDADFLIGAHGTETGKT